MELYTELFYAIIQTLFLCFLLICYPYIHLVTFLMFFILVYSIRFLLLYLHSTFSYMSLHWYMSWGGSSFQHRGHNVFCVHQTIECLVHSNEKRSSHCATNLHGK